MSYKTILLHLSDEQSASKLLTVAAKLARQSEAHLIALFAIPPMILPAAVGMPYGSDIIVAHREAAEVDAKKLKAMFDAVTANQPFTSEWRQIDGQFKSVASVVAEQARTADLTIVAQAGTEGVTSLNEVAEQTAFDSGRPILVVPYVAAGNTLGENILVAWNGRRESARAVFDALPLLKAAGKVEILTIDGQDEPESTDIPGAEIAATLARHGVKCQASTTTSTGLNVGDILLNDISDHGHDLLVMGCYGHSRIRELVFGGATNRILSSMTVPVLMSH